MSQLIDTHCHLDVYTQAGRLEAILDEARTLGVTRMIAVGTSAQDWSLYQKLSQTHSDQIFYSVGLHPCYVQENYVQQLKQIEAFFESAYPPTALGEVGLDYYHLPQDPAAIPLMKACQQETFAFQLKLAKEYNSPLIIHSRNAFKETVAMIDKSGVDWRKVVFHCFTEGPEQVRLLNERGGRASFTGVITYKKAEEVRQAFLAQPLELTMLETDAPYLAPVPYRGKENQPGWTKYIAEYCAQLANMSFEDFAQLTTRNAEQFFQLIET